MNLMLWVPRLGWCDSATGYSSSHRPRWTGKADGISMVIPAEPQSIAVKEDKPGFNPPERQAGMSYPRVVSLCMASSRRSTSVAAAGGIIHTVLQRTLGPEVAPWLS